VWFAPCAAWSPPPSVCGYGW